MIKANEIIPNQKLLDKLFLKRMQKIEQNILKQNNKGRDWTWSFVDIRIEDRVVDNLRSMGYRIEVDRFSNGDPYLYIRW